MLIDFRKDRTVIPAIKINYCVLERVSSCKLLGLWIDDDLKWKTNTECIVKNAAKRLHFLKILKGYNAPREDLKTFYISAIKINPGIWDQNLAWEFDRETIQGHRDEQALIECGMGTLENRREKMCIKLINDMKDLIHKLNELLPPTVGHVRERDTRLNFIILNVEPNVLAIVFSVCIRKYNIAIDNL